MVEAVAYADEDAIFDEPTTDPSNSLKQDITIPTGFLVEVSRGRDVKF